MSEKTLIEELWKVDTLLKSVNMAVELSENSFQRLKAAVVKEKMPDGARKILFAIIMVAEKARASNENNRKERKDGMNELKIFKSEEFGEVRTVVVNGDTCFVAKDVCDVFGETNRNRAMSHLDEEEKGYTQIETPGGNQRFAIVNESGLYSLLFAMQPQKARGVNDDYIDERIKKLKQFKRWVTHDVLPSIRRHGVYAIDEIIDNPEIGIKALTALKEERERNQRLKEDNIRMRPKEIFADAVATSHTSILIGDMAKLVKQNGIDIGQKRMFEWLRENGYLIKRKGSDWNMPTQRSMELELFEVKETTVNNPDGSVRINRTTKVTGKGQQYFINKFLGVA